ncbi:hypothetical protein L7F22_002012 [Adiantum nelumboides]|nr:hypothetical protein [Adiantum nelumboides]
MHFQKSARQWWAGLLTNGEAPKTWKNQRVSIMKQFLASNAKDKVLTKWRSLKFSSYESIHKYGDKFWDLYLKATVYKKLDFEEQKQQFCDGLSKDMNENKMSQKRKVTTIPLNVDFSYNDKRRWYLDIYGSEGAQYHEDHLFVANDKGENNFDHLGQVLGIALSVVDTHSEIACLDIELDEITSEATIDELHSATVVYLRVKDQKATKKPIDKKPIAKKIKSLTAFLQMEKICACASFITKQAHMVTYSDEVSGQIVLLNGAKDTDVVDMADRIKQLKQDRLIQDALLEEFNALDERNRVMIIKSLQQDTTSMMLNKMSQKRKVTTIPLNVDFSYNDKRRWYLDIYGSEGAQYHEVHLFVANDKGENNFDHLGRVLGIALSVVDTHPEIACLDIELDEITSEAAIDELHSATVVYLRVKDQKATKKPIDKKPIAKKIKSLTLLAHQKMAKDGESQKLIAVYEKRNARIVVDPPPQVATAISAIANEQAKVLYVKKPYSEILNHLCSQWIFKQCPPRPKHGEKEGVESRASWDAFLQMEKICAGASFITKQAHMVTYSDEVSGQIVLLNGANDTDVVDMADRIKQLKQD